MLFLTKLYVQHGTWTQDPESRSHALPWTSQVPSSLISFVVFFCGSHSYFSSKETEALSKVTVSLYSLSIVYHWTLLWICVFSPPLSCEAILTSFFIEEMLWNSHLPVCDLGFFSLADCNIGAALTIKFISGWSDSHKEWGVFL